MTNYLPILFLLFLNIWNANSKKHNFFPNSTSKQIVSHTYFTLSYKEEYEQPEWVAYKLVTEYVTGSSERTNDYREDPKVSTGSSQLLDYKGSGYDRGHLLPAGSMRHTQKAMSETFFMSNISPQNPSFNRGMWKKLENQVRKWAIENDSIFVITGPVFQNPLGSIGRNNVTVPRYFYKVIVAYSSGKSKGIGFVMENKKLRGDAINYAVSIDRVEELTGLDFFYKYSIQKQNRLESSISISSW